MADNIKKLTEDTFYAEIGKGIVLVDFYADWCGPCRMMAPVLEQVAQEVAPAVTIAKIDIDQAQKVANSFHVTSIPTLILFKEGKEAGKLVGLQQAEKLKEFIASAQK